MKYRRPEDPDVLLDWTNIGYVFTDSEVKEKNFADLMELVYPDPTELDPPLVGDKNYFYLWYDPTYPDENYYIFIYEKDKGQGYVTVRARGVSENEIRRILNNLKMKVS